MLYKNNVRLFSSLLLHHFLLKLNANKKPFWLSFIFLVTLLHRWFLKEFNISENTNRFHKLNFFIQVNKVHFAIEDNHQNVFKSSSFPNCDFLCIKFGIFMINGNFLSVLIQTICSLQTHAMTMSLMTQLRCWKEKYLICVIKYLLQFSIVLILFICLLSCICNDVVNVFFIFNFFAFLFNFWIKIKTYRFLLL